MHRNNSKRKMVIFSLLGVLLLMTVGYASLQSSFKIKGTSKVSSVWNIEITNVTNGVSTGSAENGKDDSGNVVLPSWDKLNANINADLYESGDSMTYIVTIENKGTLDAKIDDIITSNNSNDGVKVTFSGYTKGQLLYKAGQSGSTMDITVKVEYNNGYTGGPTSLETSIQFNFTQAESKEVDTGGEVISETSHKVIYDYKTNGGNRDSFEQYYQENDNIDVSKDLEKNYGFVNEKVLIGWNTNRNETSGLDSLTLTEDLPNEITLYAIYKDDEINLSVTTTSTTNSISIMSTASSLSGIKNYKYMMDGDEVTCKSGTEANVCIVENLTHNTSHSIEVTVEGNSNKKNTVSTTAKTKEIDVPRYNSEKNVVTITFPAVRLDDDSYATCDSGLICTYKKDSEDVVRINSSVSGVTVDNETHTMSVSITFDKKGIIIGTVYDYKENEEIVNTVNGSTFTFRPAAENLSYDNTRSKLDCDNAQCAIDKIKEMLDE